MKNIVIEVDEIIARNWKMSSKEVRERVARIVTRELKYPIGYARPAERELTQHRKVTFAKLPECIMNLRISQEVAASNGMTAEILKELLVENNE